MKRQSVVRILSLVSIFLFFLGAGFLSPAPEEAQAAPACPQDITSYWQFEETSGNTFGNFVTGGPAAGCTICPDFTSGRIGNALRFNGVDDAVNAPADASFDWGVADNFSIEFWMKLDSSNTCAGNQVVVGRDDNKTNLHWWVGCWDYTGVAAFRLHDKSGNGDLIFGSTPLNDGQWHHVVAVRNGVTGENSIFVDGRLEGSKAVAYSAGFDSATSQLNIGWLNINPFYQFEGAIDEVALHNRALAENEIRQHYYDGSVGLQAGYCPDCALPARIMPLGDSITLGSATPEPDPNTIVGYRQKLNLDLGDAGYNVDFAGSLTDGDEAATPFDTAHEGHGGWEANGGTGGGIAPNVNGFLVANPADVVLLHIGTNDISSGDQNVQDITDILDNIDSYSQNVSVVLARIINRTDTPANTLATTQFNEQVAAMARTRIANGDKIIIVDQENALNYPADMDDDLHPDQGGYNKMADVWFSALDTFLPACTQAAPLIITSPVTTAYVGWPYVYNVDATGNPAPRYSFIGTPPAGVTINSGTGIIQWTPSALGNYPVTVSADSTAGSDTQPFTISVVAQPLCPSAITHYWSLDETVTGSYADFRGANSATCTDCPSAVAGIVNNAQQFDAISRVSVKDDNTFDWTTSNSFSVELWMMTAGTCAGTQVLVGRDDSATSLNWWLGCGETTGHARLFLRDKGGSGFGVNGTTDLRGGSWHHIAATRDAAAGTISIYVDGIREGVVSALYPSGFDSTTAPVNIGWLNVAPFYHFEGAIDDIAVYNRALSGAEISQHSLAGAINLGYCETLAPTIYSTPVTTANELVPYSYTVTAYGNPAPTFSLTAFPAGMTINTSTGVISWTPAAGQAGANNVTVRATNSEGFDAQSFVINVTALPAYTLNITAVNGTVIKSPDQALYAQGTDVLLTATPAVGYTFTDWTGSVTSTDNPLLVDMDGNKSITANFTAISTYSVISPALSERVPSGGTYLIQWTAPPDAVSFNLKYSTNNGLTWNLIAKDVPGRSKSWDIPPFVKNKGKCLIKVVAFKSGGVKLGKVLSGLFTIEGVVKVLSPNGGGNPLTSDSYYPIEWQTSASVSGPVAKVVLSYSKNGGLTWTKIKSLPENPGDPVNPGSFNWTVPSVSKEKNNCLVKVTLKNAAGTVIGTDTSDLPFTIQLQQ